VVVVVVVVMTAFVLVLLVNGIVTAPARHSQGPPYAGAAIARVHFV